MALLDQDEMGMRTIGGEIAQAAGQEPLAIVAKVEQSSEVSYGVMQVFDRFRRIDILVNCAGTSTHFPFLELDEDAWDKVININT